MKRWSWVIALALATSSVPLATTMAQAHENREGKKIEKVIKLEDVPKAAQDSIKREIGSAQIVKVEEETYADGKVVYEAEARKGGDVLEVKVDPSGKLLKKELKKAK